MPEIFISGWLEFPSRWGSCPQSCQAGVGLGNCCMAFSGCSCCISGLFSRQGDLNFPACLTCLGAKARLSIGVLGEVCSPVFHTVQEFLMGKYDSQFVFPWWYFLKCSCHWNPVEILVFESLPFPLCLICKMEKSFPVFLELIRKAWFLITLGNLHVSGGYSCFP